MHSKSDNTEIKISDEVGEAIKKLFDSLKNRYQNNLQSVIYNNLQSSIMFIYCIINVIRINFNLGGSYIDSPDWIKNKKAMINPFNKKDKCFQYAVTVMKNHEEIKKTCKE